MAVLALAKGVQMSTRKVATVASLVRGRTVKDALIILEHGTKIVHRDGRVVQADYFGAAEVF